MLDLRGARPLVRPGMVESPVHLGLEVRAVRLRGATLRNEASAERERREREGRACGAAERGRVEQDLGTAREDPSEAGTPLPLPPFKVQASGAQPVAPSPPP